MEKMKNRPHKILGENVARLRERAGYSSAEEFAHRIGMAISSLKDIERGVAEGSFKNRRAIADALGIRLSDLYKEEGSAKDGANQIEAFETAAQLLRVFAACRPERRDFFIRRLASLIKTDNLKSRSKATGA